MNFLNRIILISLILSNTFLFADHKVINIDDLVNKIQKNDKHLMVFFHMNYCPYCVRMEKRTLKHHTIKEMIEKDFIFTHVNTDEESKIIFE